MGENSAMVFGKIKTGIKPAISRKELLIMKRIATILIVLLMLTIYSFPAFALGTTNPIKFGVSIGLTGGQAVEGALVQKAIKLACKEINENGGVLGTALDFVINDDAGTSDNAVIIAKMYAEDNSISAMLGPHMSSSVLAVDPILREGKLPAIVAGTAVSIYDLKNPYIFRGRPSDQLIATACAKFTIDTLGKNNIGMVYNTADYGYGGMSVIKEYLQSRGISFKISEGHNTGELDFTATLLKCSSAGCDAIIFWGFPSEAAILARQWKELELHDTIEMVSGPPMSSTAFYDAISEEVADRTYSTVDFVYTNPESKDFDEKFYSEYGEHPEMTAACYYDMVYILYDAITRAESADRDAIADALRETKGLIGNLGEIYCNEQQDLIHRILIVQNEGKIATLIKEVEE